MTKDGQRFVMCRPVESEEEVQPAIVIVQNWFKEFDTSETNARR